MLKAFHIQIYSHFEAASTDWGGIERGRWNGFKRAQRVNERAELKGAGRRMLVEKEWTFCLYHFYCTMSMSSTLAAAKFIILLHKMHSLLLRCEHQWLYVLHFCSMRQIYIQSIECWKWVQVYEGWGWGLREKVWKTSKALSNNKIEQKISREKTWNSREGKKSQKTTKTATGPKLFISASNQTTRFLLLQEKYTIETLFFQ